MESKRKANGHAAAVEDLDDRAVKRRKMPVSICSCYLLLQQRFVVALKCVEICRGLFVCDSYRLHSLGEPSYSNGSASRGSTISRILRLHLMISIRNIIADLILLH
jgi:hypothetical protein